MRLRRNITTQVVGQVPTWAFKLPIWILLSWLLLTVLLFARGPYEYKISNPVILYVYLGAVHLSLCFGYYRGTRSKGRNFGCKLSGVKIAKIAIGISAVLSIVELIYTKGGDISRIRLALVDPAEAYIMGSTREGITVFSYIGIITAPISVLAIALGVYYWRSISAFLKILVLSSIVLTILASVGAAIRGAMIAKIMTCFASFAAAYYSGQIRLSLRSKFVIVIVVLLAFTSFFSYFDFLARNRSADADMFINPITLEAPNEEHAGYKIIPENLHLLYSVGVSYVSHSYSRLAQALDMPFAGVGFGVGNSAFLLRNTIRLTGWEWLEDLSYGMRLDKEYGGGFFGNLWSTIYVWIASDVTFPGSIIVVYFIGYLLALSWADVLNCRNPAGVAAFSCMFFLVYSFPMNNPMQDAAGISVYFGIPLLWWMTRRRSVPSIQPNVKT